ncbi:hypothetical protein K523DRAFT_109481 [Schizophyllum commune Tattone D]|nr:hypothetical protein K523DRAFT_109481 [Schizophyllum commune Tattone D]
MLNTDPEKPSAGELGRGWLFPSLRIQAVVRYTFAPSTGLTGEAFASRSTPRALNVSPGRNSRLANRRDEGEHAQAYVLSAPPQPCELKTRCSGQKRTLAQHKRSFPCMASIGGRSIHFIQPPYFLRSDF